MTRFHRSSELSCLKNVMKYVCDGTHSGSFDVFIWPNSVATRCVTAPTLWCRHRLPPSSFCRVCVCVCVTRPLYDRSFSVFYIFFFCFVPLLVLCHTRMKLYTHLGSPSQTLRCFFWNSSKIHSSPASGIILFPPSNTTAHWLLLICPICSACALVSL